MAKKTKKKDNTYFAFQGSIREYEGSMLELHTQLKQEEWKLIIEETIKYKIFIECLEKIACPILEEKLSKQEKSFIKLLDLSIARMRNIDPLLVATFKQDEIKKAYIDKMQANAGQVKETFTNIRAQLAAVTTTEEVDITEVSEL